MVIDASALIAISVTRRAINTSNARFSKVACSFQVSTAQKQKGNSSAWVFSTAKQIDEALANLQELLEIVPFDLEQSGVAAYYYARRNPYHLSLGDCACFALAETKKLNVITAEIAWSKLPELPFKVSVIR
jgi:ribonuclease VapC